MADVKNGPRERAQLILVSGLLVAVTLLILILLLNSTIYTENVATRGVDADTREALDAQRTIQAELSAYLAAQHARDDAENWTVLEPRVEAAIEHIRDHQSALAIERGRLADSQVTLTPGLYAERNETAPFETETIAQEVEHSRYFTVTLAHASLNESLAIEANDGDWAVHVNGSDGVEVHDSTGTTICEIDPSGDEVTIDFIAETLNDGNESVECDGADGLWGANGHPSGVVSPFSIGFEPDVEANGSFRFEAAVTTDEAYEHASASPIVYEARLDFQYLHPDLRYETVLVVDGVVR